MFRTVSEIGARIGQCFIVTNTPASRQRSDRAPASLVEAGEGIDEGILRNIDLPVESPRGALVRVVSGALFLGFGGALEKRQAPSSIAGRSAPFRPP